MRSNSWLFDVYLEIINNCILLLCLSLLKKYLHLLWSQSGGSLHKWLDWWVEWEKFRLLEQVASITYDRVVYFVQLKGTAVEARPADFNERPARTRKGPREHLSLRRRPNEGIDTTYAMVHVGPWKCPF